MGSAGAEGKGRGGKQCANALDVDYVVPIGHQVPYQSRGQAVIPRAGICTPPSDVVARELFLDWQFAGSIRRQYSYVDSGASEAGRNLMDVCFDAAHLGQGQCRHHRDSKRSVLYVSVHREVGAG